MIENWNKESSLLPQYNAEDLEYDSSESLHGKVALITSGESDMAREVALAYAKEGADIAIIYHDGNGPMAQETKRQVEQEGRQCLLIAGDPGDGSFYHQAMQQTIKEFGRLDVLVTLPPPARKKASDVSLDSLAARSR